MRNVVIVFALIAGVASAADVKYAWLPFSSNVPGVVETSTHAVQYGISVLMDSDNIKVTEFQVTMVVKRANGAIVTVTGTAARQTKALDVAYSTIYSAMVDDSSDFQVLAVQVKAVTGISVTKPIAGLPYSSETQ